MEVDGLEFDFESPEIVIGENFDCRKGKRNKKMEQLILLNFNVVARVWNLVVQSQVYMGGKDRKTASCVVSPVLKFEFQN